MKPYYDHSGITIYHGDCREIFPTLTACSLITDPPFGIAWGRATWDDAKSDYPDLIRWLVSESKRGISGWNFIFQAMPNCGLFHEWFPEGWRIFAACKNFVQLRPTEISNAWDPVVFWTNNPKPSGHPGSQNGYVTRDWTVADVAGLLSGGGVGHPCPKPLDTMKHLVAIGSRQGQTVLDPFMGSGTTLRAAKDLGRQAIGIEIDERYCEVAAKRLSQEVLFT